MFLYQFLVQRKNYFPKSISLIYIFAKNNIYKKTISIYQYNNLNLFDSIYFISRDVIPKNK